MSASSVDSALIRSAQDLITYLQTLPAYQHPSGDSYIRITTLDATLAMLVHSERAVPFAYLLEREWITGYRSVEFGRVDRETLMGLWD
ncbi:hypothetical protein QFC20_005726 [Naganishia adeliensis]|uniref:Uncharacterized protein n=1 Tax=Naganishia adeliensis TaxID=92952 RepID=A0ACC2VJQ0_9TREE|nr:hypothetical protein QFC20_005726 [Naganishia adeliensis]